MYILLRPYICHLNFFQSYETQEHAKPIREVITYYLCTHSENEAVMPQIKEIAAQYVSVYLIITKIRCFLSLSLSLSLFLTQVYAMLPFMHKS
jgi:hypothetical protein